MKKISLVAFVCLGLFLVGPVFAMSEKPGDTGAAKSGEQAPEFTLKDLDGQSVSLSDFRGKVVFLNFWATWCPPCREEMPSMERLHEAMSGKDFVILALNVEKGGKRVVQDFLSDTPLTFQILLDDEGKAQSLYRVYRYPETFLIDKDGTVLQHFLGGRDWSSVDFLKYLNGIVGK